jgi:hypothetical protein
MLLYTNKANNVFQIVDEMPGQPSGQSDAPRRRQVRRGGFAPEHD